MKISANKNRVTITEREIISTGAFNAHWCEVSLSEDFDDLQNKVVFKTADTIIECNLVDGGCYVPMLTKVGRVEVGVYGYDGNQLIISPQMAVMTVNNGSYAENGEEPIIPDVPTYQQILEAMESKQDKIVFEPDDEELNIKTMSSGIYFLPNIDGRQIVYGNYGAKLEAPHGIFILSKKRGGAASVLCDFILIANSEIWAGISEYVGATFVSWQAKKMAVE